MRWLLARILRVAYLIWRTKGRPMLLRDFLTTCAALARAGKFRELQEFLNLVDELLNPPPPGDAVTVVLTPGKPTSQP